MTNPKNILCFTMLSLLVNTLAIAQKSDPLPLFPDGIPNSKTQSFAYIETKNGDLVSKVTVPTITPYFPAKGHGNGTAVLICPGGAYGLLSMKSEGFDVAQKLSELGITAFVLKYRLPSDLIMENKSVGPLQDAQKAIRLIRQHATEWQIDPLKIGIMGFSAGGHLASTAGTHFDKAMIGNKENISLRPDFMILVYPVISLGVYTHQGSKDNLLGHDPTQLLVERYSNETQVADDTPPTFLVHAGDDKAVPVQNSLLFYEALLAHRIKAEIHIYQAGGHGFGLVNPESQDPWFDRCMNWMKHNNFL